MKEYKAKNLSKKSGTACFGVTRAWACSSRIDVRYLATLGWEAGLLNERGEESLAVVEPRDE